MRDWSKKGERDDRVKKEKAEEEDSMT